MLSHVAIRNFALIDRMDLELDRGFVVVTGETGAGKSIVFDAVSLLVGARARTDVIRSGEDSCSVQGLFEIDPTVRPAVDAVLDDAGIPTGPQLLVRRTVSRTGANKVYVNDTLSTVGLLTRVLDPLVEVVGQHEQLTLVRPETHRELVDRYGGHEDLLAKTSEAVRVWKSARARLEGLQEARDARAERIEFLRFQRDELQALELRAGEMEELETALERARNVERLRDAARTVVRGLNDGNHAAVERIGDAVDAVARVADKDPALVPISERLDEVAALVADIADEARRYLRGIEGEDLDLDALESRHERLRVALRKFACDEAGAIEKLETIASELSELENYEETLGEAEVAERKARALAEKAADALEKQRVAAAGQLFAELTPMLASLGMPNARLELAATDNRRLTDGGWDGLEILFSANTGEPPGPIGRIASGGELSRLMLAIKTAASASDRLQTYTFDEVDTGIGGGTAEVVGRMLARLAHEASPRRQVLCVTHQPQIASFGDVHLRAEKTVADGRTFSRLVPMDDDEREQEIGRMLGGVEITDATLEHARSMLSASRGTR